MDFLLSVAVRQANSLVANSYVTRVTYSSGKDYDQPCNPLDECQKKRQEQELVLKFLRRGCGTS